MLSPGACQPPSFHRLGRAEIGHIQSVQLDPDQVARFLGSLDEIARQVRRGLAHAAFAIRVGPDMAGFFVLHPDQRDASCWWLGWLGVDRRWQGTGLGRAALAHLMALLRQSSRCRTVRLLVAPDNAPALRLYRQALFTPVDMTDGGELVMQAVLHPAAQASVRGLPRFARAKVGRLRHTAGPHATRVIGITRGPPLAA